MQPACIQITPLLGEGRLFFLCSFSIAGAAAGIQTDVEDSQVHICNIEKGRGYTTAKHLSFISSGWKETLSAMPTCTKDSRPLLYNNIFPEVFEINKSLTHSGCCQTAYWQKSDGKLPMQTVQKCHKMARAGGERNERKENDLLKKAPQTNTVKEKSDNMSN